MTPECDKEPEELLSVYVLRGEQAQTKLTKYQDSRNTDHQPCGPSGIH